MVDEISFNLPAMQLVCHLVTLSNITSSVAVVTDSQPTHRANDQLPDDYVAFPDICVAYKYHGEEKSWLQAMKVCSQEGGVLAVIDSDEKIRVLNGWKQLALSYIHAGIIHRDNQNWISVNTELPLSSLTWDVGYPTTFSNCACFHLGTTGLRTCWCHSKLSFLCEVPIPSNFTIDAN